MAIRITRPLDRNPGVPRRCGPGTRRDRSCLSSGPDEYVPEQHPHREHIPTVLHAGRDFDTVIGIGEEPAAEEPEAAPAVAEAPAAAPVAAPVATPAVTAASAAPLDDAEWSVGAALKALLALRVGIGLNEIGASDTVDGLLEEIQPGVTGSPRPGQGIRCGCGRWCPRTPDQRGVDRGPGACQRCAIGTLVPF